MKRNIYTALRFVGHPDVHMTLRYYKDVTPELQAELISKLAKLLGRSPVSGTVELDRVDWFGPRKNVRVLRATSLPASIEEIRKAVPSVDQYPFRPHVSSTRLEPGPLTVASVAVMCKDAVVWEYACPSASLWA